MVTEAIILAGGLGTRIQKVVKDIPKPMADINGRPFLEYLLNYLINQRIEKVILSVGYKYEVIQEYFKNHYKSLKIEYSVEKEPLGTGGGIKKTINLIKNTDIFILNGDTFFDINLNELYEVHRLKEPNLTIALKPMKNFDRYGTVYINEDNRIFFFEEKKNKEFGFINCGIYIINKTLFDKINLPEKFSFEKDLLGKYYKNYNFYGLPFDEYFVDIGIPQNYERAKEELKRFGY